MAVSVDDQFLLVAAIDFGTTFSGYAFSFRATPDNPKLHEKLIINKSWGAALGFQSYKNPTSVLTNRAGEFKGFGYDAEKKYGEALEDDDQKADMLMFRHFKMMLHNKDHVTSSAVVTSLDGTIMPALDIFAHSIRYLKDHLLNALELETGGMPNRSDIRWVITVPAIWIDESKQFMREAAFRAGCMDNKDSKNLIIALEPEAASLCCRRMNIAQYEGKQTFTFPKGTKYMVLDCGGGTVDITVHVMEFDKKVKEVMRASGGPWGGTEVDRNFVRLMETVLGTNFLNEYKHNYPHEWLQFLTNFERTKKSFQPDGEARITLTIPYTMASLFSQKNKGKPIDKQLKESGGKGVTFGNGMIVIKHEAAIQLFVPVIESIVNHTNKLLRDPKCAGMNYIFMVGGFSECQHLQQEVKKRFEKNGLKILIPSEAQLAIIKGAVLFGHCPEEISSRITKYSYGFRGDQNFIKEKHDETRRVTLGGVEKCTNVFQCLIQHGESVNEGEVRKYITRPSTADQNGASFKIFYKNGLPDEPVQYTNVPEMTEIGEVEVEIPGHGLDRELEVSFKFGGTEIEVEAHDKTSGNKATTTINFLS